MLRFSTLTPKFLVAFLVGVFIASVFLPPPAVAWGLMILSGAFLALHTIIRKPEVIVFAVCTLGLAFGVFRFMLWSDMPTDTLLDAQVNSHVVLTGVISDEPDVRENSTHLTIDLRTLRTGSSSEDIFGTLLVILPRYPEFEYGDEISLGGKLEVPEVFTEKDGRIFDYPSYLRAKDIRYEMLFPKNDRLGENKGNPVIAGLFSIKHHFQHALELALPEPHSALAGGLLLGGKQSLGTDWLLRFRTAGIVHIVVLSGYNMTVVADWLVALFRFLGFFSSMAIGAVGIMLFAVMTGGGATVMRAAIMSLIALLARVTGRNFDMGRALLIAGSLMVLENPSILLFDPSFQLSFLASLGLILVTPLVERHTALFKTKPMMREVFVSTLATQVMVLPLLLYQTGMFSLVALPVNLIVLPIIPLTMLFAFIAGLVATVVPALAIVAGLPAFALLSWIFTSAQLASQIPHAAIALPISSFLVFVIYGIFALIFWREQRIVKDR